MYKSRNPSVAVFVSAVLALAAWCGVASASEYGVSSYRPGFMDLFAGSLPAPGTTVAKTYFLYQDADGLADNGKVRVTTNTVTYTEALFLGHVTNLSLLGSNYAFAAIAQTRLAQQGLGVGPVGFAPAQKNLTIGGFGDLILMPIMLNWHLRNLHLLSALAVYAPTGSYDSTRIINIGLNRWAIEPDFGVTWMDPDTGRHASVFAGYTINARNSATHYRSGDEFHADFVAAQHLPHGIVAGVSGYALQQTTPDTGDGAIFGGYRGRVLALGPLVGKTVEIESTKINITFKYDFEFAAQNRGTGNELWLTAAVAL
jgi:hypothetical protein